MMMMEMVAIIIILTGILNRRLAVPGREETHFARRRGEGARAGTIFWREREATALGRHSGAHSNMEGERCYIIIHFRNKLCWK